MLHIHLVSDSTGETVHQAARAAIALFPEAEIKEHIWTLVRTTDHITLLEKSLAKDGGLLLLSVVNPKIRQEIERACVRHAIPHLSILDPLVNLIGMVLGKNADQIPGAQHRLDEKYFHRMKAVEYAVNHDDGINIDDLKGADMLLVGVSRTSKTPTSMYLANRGYFVANYALVPHVPFPEEAVKAQNVFVVGLTSDPKRLSQIRRSRLSSMLDSTNETYANDEDIQQEIKQARRLFARHSWPVIDVTRRSVEETAASIIHLHNEWRAKQNDEE
ncbi:MAG: pyruvate, water dikinase regulatory protein [Candidatus Puniceispirillaceae bacterium]